MSHDSTVTLRECYEDAKTGRYGFFASNVTHFDILVGLLRGSASVDADLVVQLGMEEAAFFGDDDPAVGVDVFGGCLDALATRHGIEAYCNLDHIHLPNDFDFLEDAVATSVPDSVMVDASAEAFERNVKLTAKAVDSVDDDVLVEAELGRIAGIEGNTETPSDEAFYTDPDDAVEFVERTGCDLLAVSIGTQHGVASGRDLDVRPDLAADIHDALVEAGHDTFLVVHGASGLSNERIEELIDAGVCKFNKNTRYQYEFARTAADFYHDHADAIRPPADVADDRAGFFRESNWQPDKTHFHPHAVSEAAQERIAAVMSDLCMLTGCAGESVHTDR
ncbi:class II fructose-bisphosphate aldolase [Halalkalicoccus jeotgali]|uniref:Fructose/tagatose-1,6-bisphosphate aldolase n=1 Tax=Halalkalicoccus jeotgali (strain DSM 18796 / CECT 7217 / JCM 14584 / KCTC 4019 / B3) TaxID=795797 RepID=D8JB75_HALJB|nr:class II fructose-bisphosphate aldolase [Halalkalicoccus jeotgali]ADJ16528.1 fructose/tagatose-1,6-bisphosphate aldolase [Halalkalicoccus jeotgali B3]ELY41377.1 fructose/tagatose-1,6-bisphosphate aldolase [Halalkalicoccus jeotgali B3]